MRGVGENATGGRNAACDMGEMRDGKTVGGDSLATGVDMVNPRVNIM